MRVNGSKERVRLTEADLEPSESRPVLRVAPALATLVWFGSIGLATTIYLEWLPASALFEPAQTERDVQSLPRREATLARPQRGAALAANPAPSAPQAPSPELVVVAPSTEGAAPAAEAAAPAAPATTASARPAITQSESVPESTRTIRGSYFSDNSHWAGGW